MRKKMTKRVFAAVMAAGLLMTGCGGEKSADGSTAEKVTENTTQNVVNTVETEEAKGEAADLSELTFGPGWKIDTSKDYSGEQYKRFDGMEFTTIINTTGSEVPEGMSVDDNDRVWDLQLRTGLTSKALWTANGDAYKQKQNACIASGEIPDMMKVDINQYYALVKADLIADLTDELLEGYHPALQYFYELGGNEALETAMVDGRIYGIPDTSVLFDGSPLVWIRQDWLDALNLEAPKTYADLEAIAKAFMEADFDGNGKADTYGIPVLASYTADYGGTGNMCDVFLNIGGAAPGIWQKEDDGTVIYGSLMEEAKDALTLLNGWYQDGIIPSDFATWNADTLRQVIGEDKAGIVFSPWWGNYDALSANISLNEEATWNAFMLSGEKGAKVRSAAGSPTSGIYVVRKDFEDPSAFVYAADMIANGYQIDVEASGFDGSSFETVNAYNPFQGVRNPGVIFSPMKELREKVLVTGEITTKEEMTAFVSEATNGIENGLDESYLAVVECIPDVLAAIEKGENPRNVTVGEKDATTTYNVYLSFGVGQGVIADSAPEQVSTAFQGITDSMTKYNTFLSTYENEEYTKMIMGDTNGKTVSEYFDAFVESYLAQGGAEITAEVQEMIGGN